MSDWHVEEIPDEDRLYRRVHKVHVRSDGIEPGAFKAYPKGSNRMSVDWEKYSTPEESLARMGKPLENALVHLIAGEVRLLSSLAVKHTPKPENRSHSDVVGENTNRVRMELARICILVIPLDQSPA